MEVARNREKPADMVVLEINKLLQAHDGVLIVAIDGKSGVGKSTISKEVAEQLDAVHVVCDDFFVGGDNEYWRSKSIQEKNDTVIDWKRIKAEVIKPLKAGSTASWHPFNWKSFKGLSPNSIVAEPKRVVVLDGAYSNREELEDVVDFSVLVELPEDEREKRVIAREGEDYSEDWHTTWREAMNHYFDVDRPPETYDMVVQGEEQE